MEGREPKPPEDWDEPPESGKPVEVDDKRTTPLGGPASQH